MRFSLGDTGPHQGLRFQQLSLCCQLLSQLRVRGKQYAWPSPCRHEAIAGHRCHDPQSA